MLLPMAPLRALYGLPTDADENTILAAIRTQPQVRLFGELAADTPKPATANDADFQRALKQPLSLGYTT